MTLDPARKRVVLFGGGATWEWDGDRWAQRKLSVSPATRFFHAMAYDAVGRRIILFGGLDSSNKPLADTWSFDGGRWLPLFWLKTFPPARFGHAMAFDSSRNRIVLFGGGGGRALVDTWEWDGKQWLKVTPTVSPPARQFPAMAYDPSRKRTVLFGGFGANGILSDTWEWDGLRWMLMKPAVSPPPRHYHSMAFDPKRNRVVLFGGFGPSGYDPDTWEWDGVRWTRSRHSLSPIPRHAAAMTTDPSGQVVFLFGGYLKGSWAATDECWIYGSKISGKFRAYGKGCGPSTGVVLSGDPQMPPKVSGNMGLIVSVPAPYRAAVMALGVSKARIGAFPLPFDLRAIGMPGCWLYQSHDVVFPFTLSAGRGRWATVVPSDPGLIGRRTYLQTYVVAPGANSAGALTSNGLEVVIGN